MPAPSLVSFAQHTTTGQNVTVNMPSGIVTGNLLVVILAHTGTMSTPAGWSQKFQGSNNLAVFYRWADGTEPTTYGFSTSALQSISQGVALNISGAAGSGDPFDATTTATSSATIPGASVSVTTTVADTLLIYADGKTAVRTPSTPPAGMTNIAGAGFLMASWQKAQAAVGSTGALQGTYSGTAATHWTTLLAIKPAALEVRSGNITAQAVASATVVEVEIATGSITAQAVASATVVEVEVAAGQIGASADLTAAVVEVEISAGAITSTAVFAATAFAVESRVGELSAIAELLGTVATQVETRTGQLEAMAELTAVAYPYGGTLLRAGDITAVANAFASGVASLAGDINAAAVLAATAVEVERRAAHVTAAADLNADAVTVEVRHGAVTASAVLSAATVVIEHRDGAIDARAELVANAVAVEVRSGDMTGVAILTARIVRAIRIVGVEIVERPRTVVVSEVPRSVEVHEHERAITVKEVRA